MIQSPSFGISGCPAAFDESRYHSDKAQAPLWVRDLGLGLFEAPWTYMLPKAETVERLAKNVAESSVNVSVHASYYIVLSSPEQGKLDRSVKMLADTCLLARQCGAARVVVHPGGAYDDRSMALERFISSLTRFCQNDLPDGITLYPETGGKKGSLGSLDEILAICKILPRCRPCIDFAHMRSTAGGGWEQPADYIDTFDKVRAALGKQALEATHLHVSPIKYGPKGEQSHLSYCRVSDAIRGKIYPVPEHLAEALFTAQLSCWVVSECADNQEKGALAMQQRYSELASGR